MWKNPINNTKMLNIKIGFSYFKINLILNSIILTFIKKIPIMSDYVKFPNLLEQGKKDFESTLKTLANYLANSSQSGCLKITIIEGEVKKNNFITFSKGEFEVTEKPELKANLELTLKLENWWKIARGEQSPLELVPRGKMAIRGDLHFGTTILKDIGINGSKYTICV